MGVGELKEEGGEELEEGRMKDTLPSHMIIHYLLSLVLLLL